MNPIPSLPTANQARGRLFCVHNSPNKKPAIAAGLDTLRANRDDSSHPVALPNFNHRTVKYEQFCN